MKPAIGRQISILYAIHYPVFGGPHNGALRLSPVLESYGVKTTVLLPKSQGNAKERLRAGGVEVVDMALHRLRATVHPLEHLRFGLGFLPEVQAIRRMIRDRNVNVVQVGGLVNPHAAIAANLEGVPVVWQLLDTRPPMAFRRLIMPLVARLADSVMYAGGELITVHPGADRLKDRNFVFFPPVDVSLFRPDSADKKSSRLELGIPAGTPVVGMVANVNPQKGHEYFIRAAALIRRERPEARFLVVGAFHETHTRYGERVRDLARELGVLDATVFTGSRDDVQRMFQAMDVSLITSVPHSEGTTTTAMESMACGVPVVATDVGAVAEVVDDGVTGHVVPPLDPEAIAEATLRLLRDPDQRERMGRAGRQAAVERFSVERCAETHLRAYDHALRRKGRPALLPAGAMPGEGGP